MDSNLQAGDVVHISWGTYWNRRYQTNTMNNNYLMTPHVEWGLSTVSKYDEQTHTYEFIVDDPHVYMMKCIEHGW